MQKSRVIRVSLITIIILLVLLAATGAWMYYGRASELKRRVLSAVPYPLALVNWRPITMRDFEKRLDIAEKAYQGQQGVDQQQLRDQIFMRLVSESVLRQVAGRNGVAVSGGQLGAAYDLTASQFQQQNGQSMESLLSGLRLTPDEFKNEVLKPSLLGDNLAAWFSSQENLNPQQYAKVRDLQQQIDAGADFADLAKNNTEDDAGKLTEGDMGFVDMAQALPEFQAGLADARDGDVVLVPSRYGLHLVKVLERDNNGENGGLRLHIRQIFIKPADFQAWYSAQAAGYHIMRLAKF